MADAQAGSWFARLFGAEEDGYEAVRARFALEEGSEGEVLVAPNGRRFAPGRFERPQLAELRTRLASVCDGSATEVRNIFGDVRELHTSPEAAGAVFQVASQFNCLEFVDASRTPEDGVREYEFDHTQGPACALACAASTVWRNYFAPVPGGGRGQRAERQLNNLEDVQVLLGEGLITVRNGYTFCDDVDTVCARIEAMADDERDLVRAALRVGVQWDAEVTDQRMQYRKSEAGKWETVGAQVPPVTQVFCSALSLGSSAKLRKWRPLAQLVLEAAYEATLAVAVLNARRGGPRSVYLTLLGGGAFGNGPKWIEAAVRRAVDLHRESGLTVHIVHFAKAAPWVPAYVRLAAEVGGAGPGPAEPSDSEDEDGAEPGS